LDLLEEIWAAVENSLEVVDPEEVSPLVKDEKCLVREFGFGTAIKDPAIVKSDLIYVKLESRPKTNSISNIQVLGNIRAVLDETGEHLFYWSLYKVLLMDLTAVLRRKGALRDKFARTLDSYLFVEDTEWLLAHRMKTRL
jgi:hypothetical protein